MRILHFFSLGFFLISGLATGETVCGVARVVGGNTCRALRLSFDLSGCPQAAGATEAPAKIRCTGSSADAVLKTEKANYHTLLREIAPGVWAAVGQLRQYPAGWSLPALPAPTELPSQNRSPSPSEKIAPPALADMRLLSVGGQFRLRWQKENTISPSGLVYLRAQPDFLLRPTTDLGFVFQPVLANRWGDSAPGSFSGLGIYQAHLDWTWTESSRAILGRQVLHYGDGWLLGSSDWENSRRSWDAARLVYENDLWFAEGFYARAASGSGFTSEERHLVGAQLTWSLSENIRVQPFLLWLQEAGGAGWSQATAALRTEAVFPDWKAHAQAAWQTGRASAVAGTIGLGWTPSPSWLSRLEAEAFWATRDFQNIYAVPHNHLGLTDTLGRRNALGGSVTAGAFLAGGELFVAGFLFARTDTALPGYREDALTKVGSEYASDARLLGTEWNLGYTRKLAGVELGAEAGVFFPGAFLTDQGLGDNLYRIALTLEAQF